MGILAKQKPVKLVASMIFKDEKYREKAEEYLIKKCGDIEPVKKVLSFDFTDYYYEELGRPLKRQLVCFKKLVNKEKLYKVKLTTNRIEDCFKKGNRRFVNIDPGYVTEAKLVLLTTKDYTHRIYLGGNIFAEVTLFFQKGTFRPYPWTYPDYAGREMISYFNEVREVYMEEIKNVKWKM